MQVVIEARSLKLSYSGKEAVMDGADFKIRRGEFVFLTGPSGSGKTTLVKAVYGGVEVSKGELYVGGIDMGGISKSRLYKLRRHMGIVFQDYKLIEEWTVEKNVMLPLIIAGFPKDVCLAQAEKMLKHVRLADKLHKYPKELSGGEQQRVSLARALAHSPFLLLADEPTGNLDDYSAHIIWDLLQRAHEELKTTIMVVSHKVPRDSVYGYRHLAIEGGAVYEIS